MLRKKNLLKLNVTRRSTMLLFGGGAAVAAAVAIAMIEDEMPPSPITIDDLVRPETPFTPLNTKEKAALNALIYKKHKPTIITLYDDHHGTRYTDMMIEILQNKGFDVVQIPSSVGMKHEKFSDKNIHFIDGIYLPGGPNIPVNKPEDPRMIFEKDLIDLAKKHDIPLIGICRGHQAVGHHHGHPVYDLVDYDTHYAESERIYHENPNSSASVTVIVKPGTPFYDLMQQELHTPKDGKPITYNVACMHVQQNMPNEKLIAVDQDNGLQFVAYSQDGVPEFGIRRTGSYYSITAQHHPEAIIDSRMYRIQEQVDHAYEDFIVQSTALNLDTSDLATHALLIYRKKIAEAYMKREDERAAATEVKAFTNQVKRHFLSRSHVEAASLIGTDKEKFTKKNT